MPKRKPNPRSDVRPKLTLTGFEGTDLQLMFHIRRAAWAAKWNKLQVADLMAALEKAANRDEAIEMVKLIMDVE